MLSYSFCSSFMQGVPALLPGIGWGLVEIQDRQPALGTLSFTIILTSCGILPGSSQNGKSKEECEAGFLMYIQNY